ncbi:hypothetical protein EDB19DRAFT_1828447 [Suillus lakei]|nr:hypothetical protein EDB19DRAFT_1828447 [Suillus lakei]
MSEPEAQCALNPDGSLKDAGDIVFYNNPDDAVPIVPSFCSILCPATHRRLLCATADWTQTSATYCSRKRALSSATEQLVRKKVVLQLSTPLSDDDTDIDTDHGAGQSDEAEDEDVPAPEDEPEDEPEDLQDTTIRAALSKSERSADVRTIFTRDDKHWVCTPCRDAGELESKYTFRGGISTLRTTHLSPIFNFTSHAAKPQTSPCTLEQFQLVRFNPYSSRQSTLDGSLAPKAPMFTKAGLLEYIMELIVTEDEALQLVDKPAFLQLASLCPPRPC